ncbi:protein ANTI-SILENCING 1 isoform X1 [Senna tora]|uniref:Protein ANTI-SILENCING 1 isoform X1 n=1 Tax=Senna tora TaxID=362788 RepID=A0A834TX00_9FABA|nr:protein ANTI-SILENCING 1 isoform X1 [Senna tora]
MAEGEKDENIEFKWGKKRGVGGKKKDVQFYESFTYDGVEYSLFDSVYLYKEGEPEPYIGKLIKIWETADKTKKLKVLWFFRPCEILNFLSTNETRDNELFLASGEGVGLANINPLEALVGKCNVVCISKDIRNPQPSDEELQKAEYVFYRFFDVGHRKILDKTDDKIAGNDVKLLFNKLDSQKLVGVSELGLDKKDLSDKGVERNGVLDHPEKNSQSMSEKENCQLVDTLVRETADNKCSVVEKPTFSVGLEEASKSHDGLSTMCNGKTTPSSKVEENEDCKTSFGKQKSNVKSYASRDGLEREQLTKRCDTLKKSPSEEATLRSKVDDEGGKREVVRGSLGRASNVGDVKPKRDSNGLVEDKQSNKEQLGGLRKKLNEKSRDGMQKRRLVCDNNDDDDMKNVAPSAILSKDKRKLQRAKDSNAVEEVPSKKLKLDNKPTQLTPGKLHKESSTKPSDVEQKIDSCAWEVTRRPDAPWEDRMKSAHEQGTLLLLQNLDPSLTSGEVEDIVWHGFKESCFAKMLQATAFSSPHSGQAFVIFKRREAAESVAKKLKEGCLLMSNGRPLVGSFGYPSFPEKKPTFYGHLVVDQHRMQREMKDAISTSHCSQPNNIEYDMAMEWCLLQERANYSWKKLYRQQGAELRKVKAKLKAK